MRLSTRLFRAARVADDAEAIRSGSPSVLVGRSLARAGVWRPL